MTSYTDAQKRAFALQAQKEGREAASKAAGTSTTSISAWARQFGVKLTSGKKSPGKRAGKKKRRAATNGKAATRRARGVETPTVGGLDAIRDQLLVALKGVEALRTSYRQVFG